MKFIGSVTFGLILLSANTFATTFNVSVNGYIDLSQGNVQLPGLPQLGSTFSIQYRYDSNVPELGSSPPEYSVYDTGTIVSFTVDGAERVNGAWEVADPVLGTENADVAVWGSADEDHINWTWRYQNGGIPGPEASYFIVQLDWGTFVSGSGPLVNNLLTEAELDSSYWDFTGLYLHLDTTDNFYGDWWGTVESVTVTPIPVPPASVLFLSALVAAAVKRRFPFGSASRC